MCPALACARVDAYRIAPITRLGAGDAILAYKYNTLGFSFIGERLSSHDVFLTDVISERIDASQGIVDMTKCTPGPVIVAVSVKQRRAKVGTEADFTTSRILPITSKPL